MAIIGTVENTNQSVQTILGQELKKRPLMEGNIAPALEPAMPTHSTNPSLNHLQLTRQVKAHLSLLEDMFQKKQFMLREVQGIVKRV